MDEGQHAQTGSGSEVEDFNLFTIFRMEHSINSLNMRFRKIHHVDIVTNARTIGGVIVISEDLQLLTETGSGLRDERQKVLRYAIRQLTDLSRWVRANRIEITQDGSVQLRVRMSLIADDLLVDLLGVAVRRESLLNRRGLIYRQMSCVRLTVHRAGRRENEIRHMIQSHDLQERHQTA